MLKEKGYKLIDLSFGFEDLIVKSFEQAVRICEIQRGSHHPDVSPPPLDIYMEILSSIVHKDYLIPIVEKEIGLNLKPTYCYVRKYFQGSTLKIHKDRDACEISLSYCIYGPEWEINMGDDTIITKIGNGIIYKGCEIPHGRSKPSSGEVIQVFNHWVISEGTKSDCAYDNGKNEDFYKFISPLATKKPEKKLDILV
jgi:hypothetical protein